MKLTIKQLRKIINEEVELAVRQPHLAFPVNDDVTGHGCGTCNDEGVIQCPTCCGPTDDMLNGGEDLEEVTPTGYEKVIKALKHGKSVKNPWAIAWSMKKKGIRPSK